MIRSERSRNFFFVQILFLSLLLAFAAARPSAADGVGGKLRSAFGKKEKPPKVEMSDGAEGEVPVAAAGMRQVLLVSKPRHAAAEIPLDSTLAFISFNHIEHRLGVPDPIVETVVKEQERLYAGSSEFFSEIRSERYDFDACAAQVEAAIAQHLADLNRFRVVTRDHIGSVLEEQDFANSGSVNTTTAAKLGELIGADVLIYGQVQLCVSSMKDFAELANAASRVSGEVVGQKKGWINSLIGAAKDLKPDKLRSLVLAQIQMIEADTGRQVFTTSLTGEFVATKGALAYDMSHRELVARAADDLANIFIDNFLARQEARYVGLYASGPWQFDRGIDLIQLGDCIAAEAYFRDLYSHYRQSMSNQDLVQLMYNHGIALMCANRPEEALDRLWASLRLSNEHTTFEAIEFTNELVDRGRRILQETDPIVANVRASLYGGSAPPPPAPEESAVGSGSSQ
ncbi:MAG: hypothetical protein D6696_01625 [Acidobacteria bacterium]|nr:MAG: hypothetical protein D6696_01625 [Acidobacteriota bacterium]